MMKGLKKQREAWRCVVRRAYRVLLSELFPCGGKDEGKTTDSRVELLSRQASDWNGRGLRTDRSVIAV